MGLMARLNTRLTAYARGSAVRFTPSDYINWLDAAGLTGPLRQTMPGSLQEEPDGSFQSYVQQAYYANPVVFACMRARRSLFTEARFQWQRFRSGRPGDLFSTPEMDVLETPWPGGSTGDLLGQMIDYADLAGDAFVTRVPGGLRMLRPDWVTIILGSRSDPSADSSAIDTEVFGYAYYPGGRYAGAKPVFLLQDEVAHFAPVPDPLTRFRGMSWMTPIVHEVMADTAMSQHRLRFFENGATVNLVITLDPSVVREEFDAWVAAFKAGHVGREKAYKPLYLGGGTTVTKVGSDPKDLDFKQVQGAGETRIAAAAGVPPIIVGLSEGLQAATYSNYGQARRAFADGTMRPLWRMAAAALQTIVPAPGGSRLWYDDRDIAFLQEDVKDDADIRQANVAAIKSLIDAGFEPDAAIDAVDAGDLKRLSGKHTGLYSVQLQPPMPDGPPPEPTPEPTPPPEPARSEPVIVNNYLQPANAPEVRVDAPVVNVTTPDVQVNVAPAEVHMEPAVVNVAPAEVRVDAPVVNVAAPVVTVEAAPVPEQRATTKRVERNAQGQITAVIEEPA
jgi:hypothetical protein